MSLTFDDILKLVTGPFGSFVCLIIIIYVLKSERATNQAALATERENRIKHLEEQARLCTEDRTAMRMEFAQRSGVMRTDMSNLQSEVRSLYRSMLQLASQRKLSIEDIDNLEAHIAKEKEAASLQS